MRRFFLLALLLPAVAYAQTKVDGGSEFRARVSAGVDYKIVKGLHINAEEEVRFGSNLSSLSRLQTTVGLDYKVNKYFKTGVSYSLLENYKSTKHTFSPRHRVRVYVRGALPLGDFRISLKETFQLTHRPGEMNTTQAPRNALALKSMLRLSYSGWKPVTPYIYGEMRTALNEAAVNATYNTATLSWSNYSFGGYKVVRNDRYRLGLGVDWKIAGHHNLSLCALLDWCRDRKVDTAWDSDDDDNSYLYLKSYTLERSFVGSLSLSYTYCF